MLVKTKQIQGLFKSLSCGGTSTPTATIGATGLLNVASGTFIINSSSDWTSDFIEVTVPALVDYQLVANQYCYVVVDYNGGSPIYQVISDNTTINHSNILAVYNVIWENIASINEGHLFYVGTYGFGLSNKLAHRLIHTNRFGWESGLSLGETGTRYITTTQGYVWYDGEQINLGATNSNSSNFHLYYHSAPNVWTAELRASYSNTEYDDNTGGLKTLGGGKYAVSWVYRDISSADADCFVVLGTGNFNLNEALSSQPPSLPPLIAKQGVYVGRIIVAQGASTATQIDSAFAIVAASGGSGVSVHNDLTGIQGGAPGDYYHLTSAERTALLNVVAEVNAMGEPRGFENRTSSTLAFNDGTRTFTITGTYNIWNNNTKYVKTGESYQIPNTTGTYFFYYDSAGVFTVSTSPWDILTTVPIAFLYYNATDGKGILLEERHGIVMDSATHLNLHTTRGTQLVSAGAISGLATIPEASPTVAGQTFGIGATTIADEDIVSALAAFIDGGTYAAVYRSGTGSDWRISTGLPLGFLAGASPYIAYNQLNGSTWQLTELSTNNTYVNYYLVAVPAVNSTYNFILIPGQTVYSSLANAQGESFSNLSLTGLNFSELVAFYKITYRYSSAYTLTRRARIESISTIIGNNIVSGGVVSVNHNALPGLQGGAPGEDYHLTAAEYTNLSRVTTGSFIDGSTVTLDTATGPSARWYLELSNGTTAFFSCDIVGYYDGSTVSWTRSGLTTIGIGVPIFTITVDNTVTDLNLKVAAAAGWTWKLRKL